ncbi:MAG: hypothetical protein O3C68_04260 [Proteobacteria bacterium]|nr:hypothetical protein [Pseudomonadota bacterium]
MERSRARDNHRDLSAASPLATTVEMVVSNVTDTTPVDVTVF